MAYCTSYQTRPFCRSCQSVSGCGGVRPSRPASILDWWWVLLPHTAPTHTHTHTNISRVLYIYISRLLKGYWWTILKMNNEETRVSLELWMGK